MPTYEYECCKCGKQHEEWMFVYQYSEYVPPACCGTSMGRTFSADASLASHNPLAGDRQFDGMQAPDGTNISTRDKYKRYMRNNGLTLASDFSKEHFEAKAKERRMRRDGQHPEQRAQRIQSLRDGYEHARDKSRYSRY